MAALRITSVAPNPFNPDTRIAFAALLAGDATLTVHDLMGRQVRKIALGALSAGAHEVVWDGRDEARREAASGLYFLQVEGSAGACQPAKALLLR